jgi:hypothetical protein
MDQPIEEAFENINLNDPVPNPISVRREGETDRQLRMRRLRAAQLGHLSRARAGQRAEQAAQQAASSSGIIGIQEIPFNEDGMIFDGECGICLNDFDPLQDYCKINCGHVFHCNCIRPWLNSFNSANQQNDTCPKCRKYVKTISVVPNDVLDKKINSFGKKRKMRKNSDLGKSRDLEYLLKLK